MLRLNACLIGLIVVLVIVAILICVKTKFTPYKWKNVNISKCVGELKEDYLHNGGIQVIDDFLKDDEIEEILRLSKGRLKRATVFAKNGIEESDVRTSTTCFSNINNNPKLQNLRKRVSKLTGIPSDFQEDLQIVHYEGGEYYKAHFDDCWEDSPACKADHKRGGHRMKTALMYMNDVEEGGETEFPALGIRVKPKKGRLALFTPVMKDENDAIVNHPCSLHAALPPTRGKKMSTTIWSRQGKFKSGYNI